MPTREEMQTQLDGLIQQRDQMVKEKQVGELSQQRDLLKAAVEEKRFALVEEAKSTGMKKIEDAFGTVVSEAVSPFKSMVQHYSQERLKAIDTVDQAIQNQSWWKTPLGIAAGTLQYVMSPITAIAKGAVGEPIQKATEELLTTNRVGNVEGPLTQDPITESEKIISKNVSQFVGKLGEEAVYFITPGKTLREAVALRGKSPAEIEAINFARKGTAPVLEKFESPTTAPLAKEVVPVAKETSAGEGLLAKSTTPATDTVGALSESTQATLKTNVVEETTNAALDYLKTNYDSSQRLYKNIANGIAGGEINPSFLPEVLAKHDLSPAEFAKVYVDTISTSGKQLRYHSLLAKKLQDVFSDNPEALELFAKHYEEIPVTATDKLINAMMGMENTRRALMVGQIATGMRNIASQGVRTLVGAFDESMQSVAKQMFGGPLDTKESILDGLNTVYAGISRIRPEKRTRLAEILDQNQELVSTLKFISEPVHEVGFGKVSGMFNALNKAQEFFFRRIAFESKLRTMLGKNGLDYNIINPKQIPEGFVEEASNYALEMTFAAAPKSPLAAQWIRGMSQLPFTLIQPFPRFNFANAIPFMLDHSPLGYLHAVSPSSLRELASGNPNQFAKAASRATIGTLALEGAVRLRQSEYAGERWYEVKIGENKDGSEKVIDTRSYAPFSTYLLAGEAIAHPERLKPSDFLMAAIGMSRVAGTGLVMTDWLRATTGESLEKQVKNFAGQYMASFFTPMRTASDIRGTMNSDENVVRDPRSSPLLAPIMLNLPMFSQAVPEQTSATKVGRMAKAEDFGSIPGGLMRQFTGISARTKNAIEREIDNLGIEYSRISPRSGDDKADRIIKSYMAPYIQLLSPKLLGADSYKNAPSEVKTLMVLGMFNEAQKKAQMKLAVTHPQLAINIQVQRLGAEKQKLVTDRLDQMGIQLGK